MKRKILHIVFSLASGGLENMVVDIANAQAKKHHVSIIIINNIVDAAVEHRVSSTVRLVKLERKPGTRNPFFLLNLYKTWFILKPDIIHIHCQAALNFFPGSFFNRIQTTIYTEHDTGTAFGKEIKNANKVFAISNAVKEDLWNRQSIDSKVIYNGIPLSEIPCRCEWNSHKNEYRLIQVSRLMHDKKGQDLLLEAIALLKASHPDLVLNLDFIGDGESKNYLDSMANTLNIRNQVRFLGSLPKAEVYDCLHSYDILVQPSRFEGFGLTIAEAMAAKVPVIVSDIEGPLEVIDNGRVGQLFAAGNSQGLAKAVLDTVDLYKNGKIQKQVEAAKQRAYQLFDIEKTADQYAAI